MSRAYRWNDRDSVPREWSGHSQLPAAKEHGGKCPCGTFTTRSVTVGGPGHPRNGWECVPCGEHYMALELAGADMEKL